MSRSAPAASAREGMAAAAEAAGMGSPPAAPRERVSAAAKTSASPTAVKASSAMTAAMPPTAVSAPAAVAAARKRRRALEQHEAYRHHRHDSRNAQCHPPHHYNGRSFSGCPWILSPT